MTIIEGTGRRMTKMNITYSVGIDLPSTVLKFFPKKKTHWLNESRKTGFGAHFHPYQWSHSCDCFQKQ